MTNSFGMLPCKLPHHFVARYLEETWLFYAQEVQKPHPLHVLARFYHYYTHDLRQHFQIEKLHEQACHTNIFFFCTKMMMIYAAN